ncbi:MAG: PilZ domain-containing protein [Desulfobacterales bacterium]|nr:PilZ domain-containing protein [Desulfobacterales bacterium]
MDQPDPTSTEMERRAEPRTFLEQFQSVQFSVQGMPYLYQFKIRDISSQGLCIMVRQDSNILPHLTVGDILEMEYRKISSAASGQTLRTRISHVTRQNLGRFKGHSLVGLKVVDAPGEDVTGRL